MPNIDPKITVPEGQVVHKRTLGHNHDGITSTLIDTSSYSLYDFTMGVRETNLTTKRGRRQATNELAFKSLVVAAIEERVLQPQGVVLKANSITATEIAANTIQADNLSANLVLVNNIIRSNNYQNSVLGQNGWIIYSNGKAEFNDVSIRGNLIAGNGYYGANNTSIFANSAGYFSLGSNFTWDGSALTIRGTLQFPDGSTPGTFDNGDALTSGTIGGITISSTSISGSGAGGSFNIYSNGYASFTDVQISADDGVDGLSISRDGYLTGLSGQGVRVKSLDGTTGTQLFGNVIFSPRFHATEAFETVDGIKKVYIYPSGTMEMVAESPAQMIDMKRYQGNGVNYIRFVNGNTNNAIGAIEMANGNAGIVYKVTSDIRLKTKIVPMKNGLEIIKKIQPVEYEWKEPKSIKGKGFIAQDLYEVYPEAVAVGSDDVKENPWGIDYGKLTPVLTAALKELIEKVEHLENRLNQIEGV